MQRQYDLSINIRNIRYEIFGSTENAIYRSVSMKASNIIYAENGAVVIVS
jgi:hypothetical protein